MDKLSEAQVNQLNPVSVAYVGDAVFSLFVRTRLIELHDCKSGELTRLANRCVRATAQSEMLDKISDRLTEREKEVARRARNSHTQNKAKNAGLADYRRSTALEALLGYLYLTGQSERLDSVQTMCVEAIGE